VAHGKAGLNVPMEGARKRNWIAGGALLVLVLGAGLAVGPERIGGFIEALKDLKGLIRWGGYTVLAVIVFAETGLLVGFFLPGDSLLVTAGVFSAPELDLLNIWVLNGLLIPVAILGDAVNYALGRRAGPHLFQSDDALIFKRSHLEKTQRFYARHGGKTVVIARFLPILRTFAPFTAGMAGMAYRRFLMFNVVGAVAWVASMTLAGHWLARAIPDVDKKMHIVIPIVIALSFVPGVVEVIRERRRMKREAAAAAQPPS
jgi:membrane-associated protein